MSQQQNYANLRKIVSGDIIVKCRFGNDIRRVPINQAPSYDELCLMMYRLFKNRLSNPEHITLKYTDDEGDLISMTDDTDVNHAISQSPLLKITVFDKETSDPEVPSLQDLQSQIKKLSEMLEKVMDTAPVAKETNNPSAAAAAAPEKTYRQLTTAEMAEFLDEHKLDHINKKTETTSPAGPQPIPSSSSSQQQSAVPTPASQPIQHQEPQRIPPTPHTQQQQQHMSYPPQQQQQQQQPYPPPQQPPQPASTFSNTNMPQPQPSPSYPPPTPQTPVNYVPEQQQQQQQQQRPPPQQQPPPPPPVPATPNYTQQGGYPVSAPSAPPPTSQYYYPTHQQQQQQYIPPAGRR